MDCAKFILVQIILSPTPIRKLTLQTSPLEQKLSGSAARESQSHLAGRHLHITHLGGEVPGVRRTPGIKVSPVVVRAGLLLCADITVTARRVDRAARVGQVIGGVSYAHLHSWYGAS